MKRKIAITGGIGSGKSTVLQRIAQAGYPVFSCDELYKALLHSPAYIKKIAERFPACVIDGKIDTARLAAVVFKEKGEREALNKIAHPLVMQALFERMESCAGALVFAEVPLLFEGGYQNQFDNVIVVLREKMDRISSVVRRDGLLPQEVADRMSAQLDYTSKEAEKLFLDSKILLLENNQTEKDFYKKIDELLNILSKKQST